jgi:hypothetical protein
MLRTAAAGVPLCLTVTLHDGIVLARSAFHHSNELPFGRRLRHCA